MLAPDEIIAQALLLDSDQRNAFLSEHCNGDSALQARLKEECERRLATINTAVNGDDNAADIQLNINERELNESVEEYSMLTKKELFIVT